jgi:hypothetical protein
VPKQAWTIIGSPELMSVSRLNAGILKDNTNEVTFDHEVNNDAVNR